MTASVPQLLAAEHLRLLATSSGVVDQVEIQLGVANDTNPSDGLDPVEDPLVVGLEQVDRPPGFHGSEVEGLHEPFAIAHKIRVHVRRADEGRHESRPAVEGETHRLFVAYSMGGKLGRQLGRIPDERVERVLAVPLETVVLRPEIEELSGLLELDGPPALLHEGLLPQRVDTKWAVRRLMA